MNSGVSPLRDTTSVSHGPYLERYLAPDSLASSKSSCIRRFPLWMEIVVVCAFGIVAVVVLSVALMNSSRDPQNAGLGSCGDSCEYKLVESLPYMLRLPFVSANEEYTGDAWIRLIRSARLTLDIAAFYWDLSDGSKYPQYNGTWGATVFAEIVAAGRRGVRVRIAQSASSSQFPDVDSKYLSDEGLAEVRSLDMGAITGTGAGVLHTKFLVVDEEAFYVGSANMDWKSLALVKELGVVISECSCLAQQLLKVFEIYWIAGKDSSTPQQWPNSVTTSVNLFNQPNVLLNGMEGNVFFSIAPPALQPPQWTADIDALVSVIDNATQFVFANVMDFYPESMYSSPQLYWPTLTDAFRRAVLERNVNVRIQVSYWQSTRPEMLWFMRSLRDFGIACYNQRTCKGSLEVQVFSFSDYILNPPVSFVLVNHAKYAVSDLSGIVCTSNWVRDYFFNTGGVSFVTSNQQIREDLAAAFTRDWNSSFSTPLEEFMYRKNLTHCV